MVEEDPGNLSHRFATDVLASAYTTKEQGTPHRQSNVLTTCLFCLREIDGHETHAKQRYQVKPYSLAFFFSVVFGLASEHAIICNMSFFIRF